MKTNATIKIKYVQYLFVGSFEIIFFWVFGDEKVTDVGKKCKLCICVYAGMIISFQSFSETAAIVKLFCGWLFLSFCLTFTDGQTQQRKYERNTHSKETFKNKYRNIERRK